MTIGSSVPLECGSGANQWTNDTQGNPFKAAYDEASSELTKVIREFEQLRLQREHVEKVVKVLKPAAGLDEVADMRP